MSNQDLTISIKATLDGVQEAVKTVQDLFQKGSDAAKAMSGIIGDDVSTSLKLVTSDCELLGPALATAFSPLAILSFATALVDVADKLSKFISDTFIYTDAQKEADEEIARANKTATEHAQTIQRLDDAYLRMGKTASQQTQMDIDLTKQKIQEQKDLVDGYFIEKTWTAETIQQEKAAIENYDKEKKTLVELQTVLRNLRHEHALLQNDELKPAAEAEIQGWEKAQQARIDLEKSTWSIIQSLARTNAAEREAAETQFENQIYQIKLAALSRRLEVEKVDPDRNIAQIVSLQHQIEALALEHRTRLNQIHAQGINEQKKQDDDWWKSVVETNQRVNTEILKEAKAQNNAIIARNKELLDAQAALYKEDIDNAQVNEQIKVQLAEAELAKGKISKQQEIQIVAAAKQEEIRLEIQAWQAIESLYDQEPKKVAEIEAKISKLRAQARLADAKAIADEAKAAESTYKQLWSSIGNTFKSTLDGIIQGHETAAQAVQKLLSGLLQDIANYLEQKAMKEASALVTSLIQKKTEATASIGADAGKSFSSAFADMAELGPAGLAAAPGVATSAAATTKSGGLALLAMGLDAGTWRVPFDMPAIVHSGEMVVPRFESDLFRRALQGGGSGGGVTVVVNHSVNAVDAQSFQGTIRRNSNMIANEIARALRKKGLSTS